MTVKKRLFLSNILMIGVPCGNAAMLNETVVISVGHMVGHMIERKGIIDYIELARRMPDVRFFWFGHTPAAVMTEDVQAAIKNAPSNLEFPGFVNQEQLCEAYCGADVFAFLSKEETEGRETALERSYAAVGERLKEIYSKECLTEGTPGVRAAGKLTAERI